MASTQVKRVPASLTSLAPGGYVRARLGDVGPGGLSMGEAVVAVDDLAETEADARVAEFHGGMAYLEIDWSTARDIAVGQVDPIPVERDDPLSATSATYVWLDTDPCDVIHWATPLPVVLCQQVLQQAGAETVEFSESDGKSEDDLPTVRALAVPA